ncbi:Oidioi.mRNA.OKI2018_I69.XSR.g14511.t1.cds [Oikopleura dioica]|uniref:Oidioi.mRNA.OKI2018_I69.XSR.g14511.t1.cds n=1 Tax=Oikopleura dioica TaxID=34765 RepID=A0ABN7SE03_OIKDI|nr:Oidioi.mRNA.OKI2018_I69.XSR.g14511.t1.cds [Oikopleura dioica]
MNASQRVQPVETVAETENDMAAQCQDDSRTSTKLLSLANEEDETEQEAAVVLVETRSEKVLDTVDEEPTRLSPVPTKDASESVEVNEDNIDTEAEKMTTTPELEKPDDLEKVDKEEKKDSDTKEDKVNENKSPETIIHREEPVEVLEDTQAVQEVAALEKPEKKEGATSESDEEELSEITTSESIGTKIQELARIASQAAAENEEEQPKSDISEEKRKSETESDVLAEVTESAPEKSVIDRQEEENYERKESSSAEIQEKSTEENAAMLVEEDLNEVNESVTDAEAQEPKEEVSQEKVPEVEPVPAEVISTNFSTETEVTAASLITPNDTLDNENESDPSMLNVADKVTLHERSIQLVTAGMIPSRKSSIQTDIADSSTVEEVLPISTRKSRSSSSSSNGHKDENPVESTPNIVEAKEEAPIESPAEPESIEIEGEALATSPEESPLETSEKRSSSPEAAPLEPEKSAEHKTDQIAPVERVEATETIEEEKMVVEDKEDTKMSSDAESELKEPLPEKEEIEASLSPVSDETKLSVETTSSVLDNDDTQETTSTSLANIPSPIEPNSPAEIPDMSDVTSSEAPPMKEQDSSSVPDEEIPTAKVVESDTTVTSVETLPEVPKPAEEPNLEDDATGSENTVTAEKPEAATDSKEPDENLPLVKESIDVPTETHVPSSSDTESEPTVILPESKLEMEETDLASEIVKEVEERISKSEMEANNLKEVKAEEKSEADVQVAEEVLQKDVSEEVAPEEDSVVQEVVAVVVDESAAPDAPGKPLRSKKSPSSSDNEETPGALAAENETPKNKDVKDELPTPELIDDKLSDVRKKNKSRRKRDIVTCKCC